MYQHLKTIQCDCSQILLAKAMKNLSKAERKQRIAQLSLGDKIAGLLTGVIKPSELKPLSQSKQPRMHAPELARQIEDKINQVPALTDLSIAPFDA
jgi:hypothetical protein